MPTKSEGQATKKTKWQLNEEEHFPYVTNSKVGHLSSFIYNNEEAPIRGRPTVKEIVSKFNSLSRENTPSMLSERDRKVKYHEKDSVGFKYRKGYRHTPISETESQKPAERSRKTVKKIVSDWESLSFRRVTSPEQSILKEINRNLPLQQGHPRTAIRLFLRQSLGRISKHRNLLVKKDLCTYSVLQMVQVNMLPFCPLKLSGRTLLQSYQGINCHSSRNGSPAHA